MLCDILTKQQAEIAMRNVISRQKYCYARGWRNKRGFIGKVECGKVNNKKWRKGKMAATKRMCVLVKVALNPTPKQRRTRELRSCRLLLEGGREKDW